MIKAAGLLSWRLDCIPASPQRYYVGLMKPHKPNSSQVVPNCRFFIFRLPEITGSITGPYVQMCKAITNVTAVSRS